MKKYFIKNGRFGNEYDLAWAETEEQIKKAEEKGYKQITRNDAIRYCVVEKQRRKDNPAFSGYAPSEIMPIDYNGNDADILNDRTMELSGYIWDKKAVIKK